MHPKIRLTRAIEARRHSVTSYGEALRGGVQDPKTLALRPTIGWGIADQKHAS